MKNPSKPAARKASPQAAAKKPNRPVASASGKSSSVRPAPAKPVATAKSSLKTAVSGTSKTKAVTASKSAKAPAKATVKSSAAKSVAKTPAKSATKTTVKPTAKSVAQSVKKAPTKTAAKSPAAAPKPVAKPTPKSVAKPAAKSAVKVAAKTKAPTVAKNPAKSPVKKPATSVLAQAASKAAPAVQAQSAPVVAKAPPAPAAVAGPSDQPVRSSRPSARLAALTVPSLPPAVASTAAKSSYLHTMSPTIAPSPTVSVKKDPKLANNWKTKPLEALTDADVLAMPDSEYMNDVQMAFFRRKLVLLKQDILNSAGETTEHLREETVVVPDPADRATIEEEHALELRTRDRERKLLKKIEQSIARIDAEDYGYCDETGEPIGVGRLLARPTATLSLEAQQRRELKQKMFGD